MRGQRSARLRLVDDQRTDLVLKRELSEARELQENLLSKTMPELKG